jgi:CRISPR-associated protein Cas5d
VAKGFCIEVSGAYACFTRPEMKVERVSYDVITPSAARAIFEAILWKPAIRWHITRIEVLNPIRWFSIRRNEVGAVLSSAAVKSAMLAGKGDLALYVDAERQQRAGLILRDVRYRLYATFERLTPVERLSNTRQPRAEADEAAANAQPESDAKYAAMFERRARKGQCFNQPYLGTREFSCDVRWVEPNAAAPAVDASLNGSRDLGFMLFDLDFGPAPHSEPQPMWYRPTMHDGVISVPRFDSAEVLR